MGLDIPFLTIVHPKLLSPSSKIQDDLPKQNGYKINNLDQILNGNL